MTLEAYFREHMDGRDVPVIDYAIRVDRRSDGSLKFYIHPACVDGLTRDFVVRGSIVAPGPAITYHEL